MSAYAAFSQYYDALTQNVGYQARADLLCRLLEKWHHPAGITLDLACGPGSLTCELKKRGLDVYGIDASPDMLAKAQEKAAEEGLSILFLCQKMQQIDLYGTINTCFCTLDSLNHLPNADAVQRTFNRVALFMEQDGLFIFDVNTLYKHEMVLGHNVFIYDTGEVFCAWQNRYEPATGRVHIDLDFFEKIGHVYQRSSEHFTERAYPLETISAMLEKAGFAVLEVLDENGTDPAGETTQRALFVARLTTCINRKE